jgi:hypothetical protein
MTRRRVIARFQPQEWEDDYAVDIDGAYDFDVTDQIVAMGKRRALKIKDARREADDLWYEWVKDHPTGEHDGPFLVTVEDSIRKFHRSSNPRKPKSRKSNPSVSSLVAKAMK